MKRTPKKLSAQVSKRVRKKDQGSNNKIDVASLIPTGSTLLNLALSDHKEGGYHIGKMANIIGDSSAGKTILALTMFAEIANDPRFKEYKFIYDDVEVACEFNISKLFGEITAKRISIPKISEDNEPEMSDTIQDFHENLYKATKDKAIYVLDSLDAIDTEEDQSKVEELIKARAKGEKTTGTYGMSKQKRMSWLLRHSKARVKKTDSLLIIISQTRDNIGVTFGSKKTRSGGRALKFYCTHEMWLSVEKTLKSKGRVIGQKIRVKVSKNKLTGKVREVTFPIYYDYGIDDIGSCVDFLVEEGHWKKKGNTIIAEELDIEAGRANLIRKIEENDQENKLRRITERTWLEIEEKIKLNRKPRY